MTEQEEDLQKSNHWRSSEASFIMLRALKDVMLTLFRMYLEATRFQEPIREHYAKYGYEASKDFVRNLGNISQNLLGLSIDLNVHTRTAILMAIIDLEANINRFCYYNLGENTAEAVERLSLIEKLEVIHAVLGQPGFKGTKPYESLRGLVNWRNAFVHGKRPSLPYNKLKKNHLKPLKEVYTPANDVKEMHDHLESYLSLHKHLSLINKYDDTRKYVANLNEIEKHLTAIKKFKFDRSNWIVVETEPANELANS